MVDFWAHLVRPVQAARRRCWRRRSRAAKGKVRLVKIDIDKNPELAQQLRIQSIPTVYAFFGGQPVDGFAGRPARKPDQGVRRPADRADGRRRRPQDGGLEAAQERGRARASDAGTRRACITQILADEPANAEAIGGLARCLHRSSAKSPRPRQLLDSAPKEAADHVAVAGAEAALTLAEQAGVLGDPADADWRGSQADPNDHEARYRPRDGAVPARPGRDGDGPSAGDRPARPRLERGAARKQLVKFFEALGPKHPATSRAGGSCPRSCSHERERRVDPTFDRACRPLADLPAARARCCCRAATCRSTSSSRAICAMVRDAMQTDRMIGMIQPTDRASRRAARRLYPTGCAGRITNFTETDDGRYLITLTGVCRFDVGEELTVAHALPPGRGRLRALAPRSGARGTPRSSRGRPARGAAGPISTSTSIRPTGTPIETRR